MTAPELVAGVPAAYALAVPLAECSALAGQALIRQHEDLLAWPAVIARWRALPSRGGLPRLPSVGGIVTAAVSRRWGLNSCPGGAHPFNPTPRLGHE